MKKFTAALIALALLLSAAALAFNGEGYPQWDGSTEPQSGLSAAFGSERISLDFDPSPDFSNIGGGVIQACFYAYDARNRYYLELYLLLPDDVASGDVIRGGAAPLCSFCLYETGERSETTYYAGDVDAQLAGNSTYELTIDSVENTGTAIDMRGHFTAEMCRFEREQPTDEMLRVDDARFAFSLPLDSIYRSPEPTQDSEAQPGFPELPEATPAPEVTFPALPENTEAPGATFPGLPENTPAPNPTFPGLPQETTPPGSVFPGLPQEPGEGRIAPAFTLPPRYAVI